MAAGFGRSAAGGGIDCVLRPRSRLAAGRCVSDYRLSLDVSGVCTGFPLLGPCVAGTTTKRDLSDVPSLLSCFNLMFVLSLALWPFHLTNLQLTAVFSHRLLAYVSVSCYYLFN